LPIGSPRVDNDKEDEVRAVALDVHRDFCEVAIVAESRLRSAVRIQTRPEALELFAQSVDARDWVALEVTGNAWAIARIVEPHVARVIVVSPSDTGIRQARAKTDRLDARALAKLLWAGHWDPFTELALARAVTVNVDVVRTQCRLGKQSTFAVIATWRAPTRTRLGGASARIDLGDLTGVVRAPLSLTIAGRETGGRLDLTTQLVLRSPGPDPTTISPRRPGSILWTETQRVALEGGAARFPTAAADFSSIARVPDNAAWYLDWDPHDLSQPVMGGLRLLVNKANERVVSAVRTASADPASSTVRAFILVDVARQVIRGSVENEQFIAAPDSFPDNSIGRMARDLIATIWPGLTVDAVRARALSQAPRFETEIQAALELMA
jgi:hypothetical protein